MTPQQQHKRWRADVQQVVNLVETRFPSVECITYIDHPWPGWDGQSFDVWAVASTWTPADLSTLHQVRRFVIQLPGKPFIRHWILRHTLWTSFGGRSRWEPNDHSGSLLHLHVTYW